MSTSAAPAAAPTAPAPSLTPRSLLATLLRVRIAALEAEAERAGELDDLAEPDRASGENLVHYLAMRRFDLRSEQRALARLGLSSLGRAEAHVLGSLDAVITRLASDVGEHGPRPVSRHGPSWDEAGAILEARAEAALGARPSDHATRIMVTLPGDAAHDTALVERLIGQGMTIARINGAHDGPDEWRAMADNVRAAAGRLGVEVRIAFDLAGPKLRIGELDPVPGAVRVRPRRDRLGRVIAPGFVSLASPVSDDGDAPHEGRDGGDDGEPASKAATDAVIPVGAAVIGAARVGDVIRTRDARGRRRALRVVHTAGGVVVASTERTVYVGSGLPLQLRRRGKVVVSDTFGELAPVPGTIELRAGDRLELHAGRSGGRAAQVEGGVVVAPASVGIELDGVIAAVEVGHRVIFDDGAIEGVVVEAVPERAVVEILHPASAVLRAEKGVNLPDTPLALAGFTDDDRVAVEQLASRVDLFALSFVDDPDDVSRLHAMLDALGATGTGVVIKIERRTAFESLPDLLLRALRRPPVAVMVARGDLAVEVGFERLAEVQEQILWLCEAAHIPVIWATQVLESLAKRGAPTRAEVTDAAWAVRAECVMLNKGPHIVEAVAMLDGILSRMQQHQEKRTPMMRPLSVAAAHVADTPPG